MRVLITGGTGFIGSRLASRSLTQGHSVAVLDQVNTPTEGGNHRFLEGKGIRITPGSVTESDRLLDRAKGCDGVFHLAAAQHEAHVPDRHF